MFRLRRFLFNRDGIVTIEFAFVVIPFIMSILFIMELCRLTYIMSSIDLIMAEASSATSTLAISADNSIGNNAYFQEMVDKMSKESPLLLFGDMKVTTEAIYCANFEQLTSGTCTGKTPGSNPLGIYKVEVPYKPLFFIFPTPFLEDTLVRKIVLIQENNLTR